MGSVFWGVAPGYVVSAFQAAEQMLTRLRNLPELAVPFVNELLEAVPLQVAIR